MSLTTLATYFEGDNRAGLWSFLCCQSEWKGGTDLEGRGLCEFCLPRRSRSGHPDTLSQESPPYGLCFCDHHPRPGGSRHRSAPGLVPRRIPLLRFSRTCRSRTTSTPPPKAVISNCCSQALLQAIRVTGDKATFQQLENPRPTCPTGDVTLQERGELFGDGWELSARVPDLVGIQVHHGIHQLAHRNASIPAREGSI
jgi:hypothetical protein